MTNPLFDGEFTGTKDSGIVLSHADGMVSDVYHHPLLECRLKTYGKHLSVKISADRKALRLTYVGALVGEIPGEELRSSVGKLLFGRELIDPSSRAVAERIKSLKY